MNYVKTDEGAESEEAIAGKFKEVYEALYNSVETTTDTLKQKMKEMITEESVNEVDKITKMSKGCFGASN